MLALYVDYNRREFLPNGSQAIEIVLGSIGLMNPSVLEQKFEVGSRVILYDEGDRCLGVLRSGEWIDGWVAEIIPETVEEITADEFEELRAVTKRAALHAVD